MRRIAPGGLQSEAVLPMIPAPPTTRQWDWNNTTVTIPLLFSPLPSFQFHYHSSEVTRDCKSRVKSVDEWKDCATVWLLLLLRRPQDTYLNWSVFLKGFLQRQSVALECWKWQEHICIMFCFPTQMRFFSPHVMAIIAKLWPIPLF